MRRSLAAGLAVLAAAGAGCREQDGDAAVTAVHEMIAAIDRGDGHAACDRLAEAGVSELLLAAVRAGERVEGLEAPEADPCALVAERLSAEGAALVTLREAPVSAVRVEGDRATVETHAGAYEVVERDGRWLVSGLAPVARVLAGEPPPRRPVHLTVVEPKLSEPAVGPALAGRADDDVAELQGTLVPEDAELEVRPLGETRVESVEAGDGRFRVRLKLRPGRNDVVLAASAPGNEPVERRVRLVLE